MKSDAFESKPAVAIADEKAETGESKVISRYDKHVPLLKKFYFSLNFPNKEGHSSCIFVF